MLECAFFGNLNKKSYFIFGPAIVRLIKNWTFLVPKLNKYNEKLWNLTLYELWSNMLWIFVTKFLSTYSIWKVWRFRMSFPTLMYVCFGRHIHVIIILCLSQTKTQCNVSTNKQFKIWRNNKHKNSNIKKFPLSTKIFLLPLDG